MTTVVPPNAPAVQEHVIIADNAAGVVNHLVDKVSGGLDAVAGALSKHAPEAWHLATQGVYAKGYAVLTVGFIELAVSLFLLGFGLTLAIISSRKTEAAKEKDTFEQIILGIVGVISLIFSFIMMIMSLSDLLSATAWAQVVSPDGWLAQDLLTKALTTVAQ